MDLAVHTDVYIMKVLSVLKEGMDLRSLADCVYDWEAYSIQFYLSSSFHNYALLRSSFTHNYEVHIVNPREEVE